MAIANRVVAGLAAVAYLYFCVAFIAAAAGFRDWLPEGGCSLFIVGCACLSGTLRALQTAATPPSATQP